MPEWYNDALSANKGEIQNFTWATSRTRLEKAGIHASETAWVGTKFDAELTNDGSIDDLFAKVKDLVSDPLDANVPLLDEEFADSLSKLS